MSTVNHHYALVDALFGRILMPRFGFTTSEYGAIAVGGTLGASLRWAVTGSSAPRVDGGWFSYAPNPAVTIRDNASPLTPTQSSQVLETAAGIPIDTLAVNLLGCLLLGALTLLLLRSTRTPRQLLLGAATGFCGSLTTFSTFMVELGTLLRGRPASLPAELSGVDVTFARSWSSALLYLLLSVGGGALAFWTGRRLAARTVMSPGEIATGGKS